VHVLHRIRDGVQFINFYLVHRAAALASGQENRAGKQGEQ